ncbi:MAG TPA: glycosyltransferase family 4 protein [Micromonosporaceae bacterium]
MRVAQVTPAWLPVPAPGYGGIELLIASLTDALVARGHEVTMFGTGDCVTRAKLRWLLEKAPGRSGLALLMNALEVDTRHAAMVLDEAAEFDIVHVHSPYGVLLSAALAGLPTVHTDHGWHDSHPLFRTVAERVDFVAPSHAYLRELPALPYTHMVHHGIDVERYPFRAVKDDYVVFIGRMVSAKGLHRAIGAAREAGLRLKAVGVSLGFDEEERYFTERIAPLLADDVELVRHEVGFDEKVELLSRARAMLFPIDWPEPFGLIVPEAMACGTPVLASRCSATPELIDDGRTGFIVDLAGYESTGGRLLREQISGLDPADCRRWVQQRFGIDRMVEGYERVYQAVLNRRKGFG